MQIGIEGKVTGFERDREAFVLPDGEYDVVTVKRGPVTAHRAGYVYVPCPACNRPPHEGKLNPKCRRCKGGFGYLIVPDKRFALKSP